MNSWKLNFPIKITIAKFYLLRNLEEYAQLTSKRIKEFSPKEWPQILCQLFKIISYKKNNNRATPSSSRILVGLKLYVLASIFAISPNLQQKPQKSYVVTWVRNIPKQKQPRSQGLSSSLPFSRYKEGKKRDPENEVETESDCDIQLFRLALSEIYGIDMLLVFWFALKLQDTFVSCIADLFENQVVQFDGILKSGCYSEEVCWTVVF